MTQKIPTVPVGDGVAIPVVGFGTWQIKGRQAYESVRQALELGYRHLDTATLYGNEAEVGRAVRDSGVDRAELFITTKLQPRDAGRERKTIEGSLRALDTGYVDLWLIHWPTGRDALVGTWERFLEIRDAGLARSVGVSNYGVDQLDRLAAATGEMPPVNQVSWSPVRHDPAALAAHRERGVVVEGYSSLKGADLRDPVLTGIADRHGVTAAQVVLRWHLEHGIVMIPKSVHRERMAANLDLFGFTLDADEVARIDGLS
jgi:diketogulonate reductase-like aldo/keto reductase